MYSNPPRIPSRGLGTGLLAGFFGWVIAVALVVALDALRLPPVLLVAAFAIPVGAAAWLVRPTSWGVPVLYVVLSIPGYLIATIVAAAIAAGRPAMVASGVFLGVIVHAYVSSPRALVFHGGALLLVLLLSLSAVLFGRSRAARSPAPAGRPPGYPPHGPGPYANRPPYPQDPPPRAVQGPRGPAPRGFPGPHGPAPQGPQGPPRPAPPPGAVFPGPASPADTHMPPPGPQPAHGPAPGPYGPPDGTPGPYGPSDGTPGPAGPHPAYGPPDGTPGPAGPHPAYGPPDGTPGPAGPPAASPPGQPGPPVAPPAGPAPGGTRRLDPDEFDQMLYEAEQERRARED